MPQQGSHSPDTKRNELYEDDGDQGASSSQQLLFVNQCVNEPSRRRRGPDRRTIASHVQRNIHRNKRTQAALRLHSRVGVAARFQVTNAMHRRGNESALPSPSFVRFPSDLAYTPWPLVGELMQSWSDQAMANTFSTGSVPHTQSLAETVQQERERFFNQFNSPRTPLDMGLINSLDHSGLLQFPVPNSTKTYFLYFLTTIIPKISPVSSLAAEHCQWIFQAANSNPELLLASSTIGSASCLTLSQTSSTGEMQIAGPEDYSYDSAISEALWCKARAATLLKDRIADHHMMLSNAVLYTVMCLLMAALVGGELSEARIHALGLKQVLELRGTLGAPPLVWSMSVSTLNSAAVIVDLPQLEPPQVSIETDQVQAMFRTAFDIYPTLRETAYDLINTKFRTFLNSTLIKAFREMREYVILEKFFRKSNVPPTVIQGAYFNSKCCHAHFQAGRCGPENETPASEMQEPCRIALLIFWNIRTQLYRRGSLLYETLGGRLKSAMEEIDIGRHWQESFSVTMWVCLLGSSVSTDLGDRPWYISRMVDGMHIVGRTDWAWMEKVLQRLLYIDYVYQEEFLRSWQDACDLAVRSDAMMT